MTTQVIVDAHAGWDIEVEVVAVDSAGNEISKRVQVVEKHSKENFYIHSNMQLGRIRELKSE